MIIIQNTHGLVNSPGNKALYIAGAADLAHLLKCRGDIGAPAGAELGEERSTRSSAGGVELPQTLRELASPLLPDPVEHNRTATEQIKAPTIDLVVNDLPLPLWAALPDCEAARLAVAAAEALDAWLESYPPALLAEVHAHTPPLGRARPAPGPALG